MANQTITFTSTPPANASVGGPTYTVVATGGGSGNPVVFSIDPAATAVCDLSGPATVSFAAAGTCVIDANQAGNANYTPAQQAQRSFPVSLASQTISFTAPASGVVNGSMVLSPTASSGLSVTLTVDPATSPPDACILSGHTVDYMHTGDCVIDANQAGNNAYAPALQVQQTITVGPTSQTVSFTTTAPASATLGGPTYTPAATASSTLPVTISLDATSTGCALNSGVVSFTAAGTCVIDANQTGNGDYQPAPQAQQKIPVAAAITPTSLEALTLVCVQSSAQYRALTATQQVALNAAVRLLVGVLSPIGPNTPPLLKAALITTYKAELALLRGQGWLSASQTATLTADANTL